MQLTRIATTLRPAAPELAMEHPGSPRAGQAGQGLLRRRGQLVRATLGELL